MATLPPIQRTLHAQTPTHSASGKVISLDVLQSYVVLQAQYSWQVLLQAARDLGTGRSLVKIGKVLNK
ncbi:hypothetical protein PG997_001436 [Apiospora hydei]|uniref:Uncharacterized protein n=1 Tax=Apiospora hydei TaxID=1337664 RepID=A0ABR1XDK2_9PEZI